MSDLSFVYFKIAEVQRLITKRLIKNDDPSLPNSTSTLKTN